MAALLLYEANTAFHHSLWSRYEMLNLWQFSPELLQAHNRQLISFGYSPMQDAFYALNLEEHNLSKAGQLWGSVMQTPQFEEAVQIFETAPSMHTKANVVYWLGLVYEYFIQEEKKKKKKAQDKCESPGPIFSQPAPPQPGDPKPSPDGGTPTEYDLESDDTTLDDMLTDGQGETEEPGDVDASPQAGPGKGFKLEIPEGFKMPSLSDLRDKNSTDEILGSFAGTEDANAVEKRRLVEDFHKARGTRNFAKFLGFAQAVVGAATREVQGAHGHTVGYSRGRYDGRVTSQEKVLLAKGDLMALSRFADGKLRKKVTKSNIPMGNGDVYLLRDESSSMTDNSARALAQTKGYDLSRMTPKEQEEWQKFLRLPDKDTQAQNLEIALAYHFKRTGRALTSVAWNAHTTRVYEYGKPGLANHLNSYLSGGTDLIHVLNRTFDLMEEKHSDQDDILIVTDGEVADSPSLNTDLMDRVNQFKKRGGRIWAVLIGNTQSGKLGFCDGVLPITSLTNSQKELALVVRKMAINRAHKGAKLIR